MHRQLLLYSLHKYTVRDEGLKGSKLSYLAIILVIVVAISLSYIVITGGFKEAKQTQVSESKELTVVLKPKALIADALCEDFPNDELIEYVKDLLERKGYEVHVVRDGNVTIELFKHLTNYDVILLRLHGGSAEVPTVQGKNVTFVGLFTGEPWNPNMYKDLRERVLVTRGVPFLNRSKAYFAILPRFILEEVEGKFRRGTVVIVASCYGVYTTDLAYAMLTKGASYYIGWGGPVTVPHMDKSVRLLFKLVFEDGMDWKSAVKEVSRVVGRDPVTNSSIHIVIPLSK